MAPITSGCGSCYSYSWINKTVSMRSDESVTQQFSQSNAIETLWTKPIFAKMHRRRWYCIILRRQAPTPNVSSTHTHTHSVSSDWKMDDAYRGNTALVHNVVTGHCTISDSSIYRAFASSDGGRCTVNSVWLWFPFFVYCLDYFGIVPEHNMLDDECLSTRIVSKLYAKCMELHK